MTILDVQNAATLLFLPKRMVEDLATVPPVDRAEEIAFEMERGIRNMLGLVAKEHIDGLKEAVATLRALAREPKCDRCGEKGEPAHLCPFKSDVNNDSETLCNCCDNCAAECAADI